MAIQLIIEKNSIKTEGVKPSATKEAGQMAQKNNAGTEFFSFLIAENRR